jgi:outer membrane protein OmpA-like peptidoglycan-associated protein
MKIEKRWLIFSGLVILLLSVAPAQASDVEGKWRHKGWTQWHPHQGSNALSAVGTQQFFAPADPEAAKAAKPVKLVKPIKLPPPPKREPVAEVKRVRVLDIPKVAPPPPVAPPPSVAKVEVSPDLDGDGVLNEQDLCPDTPNGETVNRQGCWILGKIFFLFEKADILPRFIGELDRIVSYLKANPELKVELQGHTDNLGGESLNDDLSNQRAIAVMDYFNKNGIKQPRMKSIGFGSLRPDTDNSDVVKRFFNRRVEVHPFK